MLYALFLELADQLSFLNVFQYLTFRSICAVITGLVVSLAVGPYMIRKLQIKQIDQTIREDGPPTHFEKVGTPTMGGLLILSAVIITTLIWGDLSNRYVWIALFVFVAFGLVGFWDDYKKLIDKNPRGMGSLNKILGQSVAAIIAAFWLYSTQQSPAESTLIIPFFKDVALPLGGWFLLTTYLVVVGSSNANGTCDDSQDHHQC